MQPTGVKSGIPPASQQLTQPVVHFGLVASGDTVMRSGRDRDDIARRDNVIAFEMEGAGMWEVLRASSCLIIKSVCDYADSHKNKKFQAYAAAVAAATAKALLQSWDSRK
jgi:nucleoside phosphorylase